MSQPPVYSPITLFQQEETNQVAGRSTVRTSAVDAEFAELSEFSAIVVQNLSYIQRDDKELRDAIVKLHTLATDVLALLGSAGFTIHNPIGWLTATAYPARDIVTQGTGTYVSVVAHTSGTFATDLAAGKWVLIYSTDNFAASGITFSPTGGISSSNVQSALAELDTEKMRKDANLSDVTSITTSRTNLSVFSKAEIQQVTGTFAIGGGTANAIDADYLPAITALVNGLFLLVRAPGANTSPTPTFTPNFGVVASKMIVKGSNQPLVPGDIAGANHLLELSYDSGLDKWTLLNPNFDSSQPEARGTDIAAGSTLAIPSDGNYFYVTGSGNVNDFSSKAAGTRITLRFVSGAVTLLHSTNLVLQGAINATPPAGELLSFRSDGGGVWAEESRRELPPRVRVGAKLALANLAA